MNPTIVLFPDGGGLIKLRFLSALPLIDLGVQHHFSPSHIQGSIQGFDRGCIGITLEVYMGLHTA